MAHPHPITIDILRLAPDLDRLYKPTLRSTDHNIMDSVERYVLANLDWDQPNGLPYGLSKTPSIVQYTYRTLVACNVDEDANIVKDV